MISDFDGFSCSRLDEHLRLETQEVLSSVLKAVDDNLLLSSIVSVFQMVGSEKIERLP